MRTLYVIAGSLCVGLGVVGMVVPLIPTTPFLLLAAACYAKGSNRLHHWLTHHRWFGGIITTYRAGKGIPNSVKVATLLVLWITMLASAAFVLQGMWSRLALLALATGISAYVLSLPTRRVELTKVTVPCGDARVNE